MNLSLNKDFVLKSITLILVYLAAAKIGLTFGTINNSATIFWPPGGIALAAVLIGGRRYLPAVFIAACMAGVMINAPFIFGLGSAVGNVLETYLGYCLLKRFGNLSFPLNRVHDLLAIIVLGALIPAIASATLGPITLLISGTINTNQLPNIMWIWWKSDVLGIAFFTPLLLLFADRRPFFVNAARVRELLALWIAAIITGQIVFMGWAPFHLERAPVLSWIIPVLIWAGIRTGRRNTALIQLLFLSQALSSAYLHTSFFANEFSHYGLSNFWIFAILLATASMAFAIMSGEMHRTARKNQQHAKLFEMSHDGVMITDADNHIVSVNAAFTDITGYTSEEVIGKNPRLLSSDRQSKQFYAKMWEALIELGYWQGEVWNRRKDGSTYLQHLIIHTITDVNHKVVSRIGSFSDITLQKSTENELRKKERYQRALLDNFPFMVWLKDIESRFLTVNQALINASGVQSSRDLIGKTGSDIYPPDLYDAYIRDDIAVMKSGQQKSIEEEILYKGERKWHETYKAPIIDTDGSTLGTVGFARDITERKQSEQQRLAHEVKLRNTLVREVHHRIKNSLHGITGLLERDMEKQPELRPLLTRAISRVQSIAVIHGLHGRSGSDSVFLCEIIKEMVKNQLLLLELSLINITIDIPPNWTPSKISAENEVPLALVINELLLNAIKHSISKENVTVSLRRDFQHDMIVVTITNSGQLSRNLNAPNIPDKGTGLGLVMSLMPEEGATLSWQQSGDVVITRLELTQPAIILKTEI